MKYLRLVFIAFLVCCTPAIEKETSMTGFADLPTFDGAGYEGGEEDNSEWEPESGDAELRRQAKLHGTGTGIRTPGNTNLGKVITYSVGDVGDVRRALVGTAEKFDGNNWIFTLQPRPKSTLASLFNDRAKALVQFGVGGGMATFEVSIAPFVSMSLPGLTAIVDIDTRGLTQTVETEYACTLHRGMPNGESEGRLIDIRTADGLGSITAPIPRFAKRLQTLGNTADVIYGGGVILRFNTSATQALEWTGPELLAIKNAGNKLSIPGGCTSYTINGLVALDIAGLSWDIEV